MGDYPFRKGHDVGSCVVLKRLGSGSQAVAIGSRGFAEGRIVSYGEAASLDSSIGHRQHLFKGRKPPRCMG